MHTLGLLLIHVSVYFAAHIFNKVTEPYFALALLSVSYSLSHGDNGWHMFNISLCFPPPAQAPADIQDGYGSVTEKVIAFIEA